jgi:glycosyltransferase involved in cell wall biosynthesis
MQRQGFEFSVLLPTYKNDDASELRAAIESVFDQTCKPDEILVVKDGPIPTELEQVIDNFRSDGRAKLRSVQHQANHGLSVALQTGVKEAKHQYIARMDADDISIPTRFEKQIEFLHKNPEVDIVGGYIAEFETDPEAPISRREVPTTHTDIEQMAQFRSPVNHGTVMFKRATVLQAGNYRPVNRMEDYDLWVRMIMDGATFANIPEVLVKVRAGPELADRRGGIEYAREELRTQWEFYKHGFISRTVCAFNISTRVTLRLLPNQFRRAIYKAIARK